MHVLTFTLKRAQLASHKLLLPFAVKAGLTPARFDLLFVLERGRYANPFQYWVATSLGVSRATVCKIIRRMREAGLVELSVDPTDRRRRRISITALGRKCYGRLDKMRADGKIARAVRAAWRTERISRHKVRFKMMEIVEGVGRYLRGLNEHILMFGNQHVCGYGYDP